ncbi:MAG: hypothetical protein FJW23_01765 [Acidimicrobiia bacterium]|nr:hypothetical protein [Acidimicrobiia bacterium]
MSPDARRDRRRQTWTAALAYAAITFVMTWPLGRGLASDVAWDLGDSILNMWILAWGCRQFGLLLSGHLGVLATFFDANIFHPEPLTLAYSEHLIAQALQACPIYAVAPNPILIYNLLFLSTFVLSGLGTFLLLRELGCSPRAAFVAGLLFAFAPYRMAQSSHLQVMSAQWMAFTLFALRRYFDTASRWALAGAAAAFVAQGLSCGYYLLYFAPFAAAYVVWDVTVRGRWRTPRTWVELSAAGLASALVMAVFLYPYLLLRDVLGGGRDLAEVASYSADAYAYLTAAEHNRVWGPVVRAFPRAEGDLFPGAMPMLLALAGITAWLARCRASDGGHLSRPARALVAVAMAAGAFVVLMVFERRITIDFGLFTFRAADIGRPLVLSLLAAAAAAGVSPRVRASCARAARQPELLLLVMIVAAWWLSLGPAPTSGGRPLDLPAPYRVLFEYVPGFEGLRVPARFGMIGALALAALGGFGLHALATRWRSIAVPAVAAVLFLAESASLPFVVNGVSPLEGVATPEGRLYRGDQTPAVYEQVSRLPAEAVLIEFPFGWPDYDLRAMFYSTRHWRPLVNGYSGFFPPRYGRYASILSALPGRQADAATALGDTGATHAIVHEAGYLDGNGPRVTAWLRSLGAGELFREGPDVLLRLPRSR